MIGVFLLHHAERLDSVGCHAVEVVEILIQERLYPVDFADWATLPRHILFLGMFVGGMAGSTTCSIRTLRWLVVLKAFRRDLFTAIHPEAIRPVRLSGSPVDEGTIRDIHIYTLVSIVIFSLLTVFVIVNVTRTNFPLSEFEAMGAAASTFLNNGPAFGFAGSYRSYVDFPVSTKITMAVLMWVGRIEIVPVLVIFTRAF